MAQAHVIIRDISKTFGKTKALDGISLEIAKGSFTTLLGPSGCGKTTLLRTIAGFYEAEKGDIYVGEKRVNDVPSHLRNAVMVFQDYALFPHMNIRENITYGLRIRKTPREEVERKLEMTAGYLDIKNLLDRTPGQVSGGQQQRVALARALVMEPEVLLLDEPLSNLDAKLRVSIRAELRQLQQRLKITTIYVTHDQAEALAMSDMIAVMKEGRIMQIGTPSEVYYRPNNAFVASFVGTVNFIEGKVKSVSRGHVEVETNGRAILVKEKETDKKPLRTLKAEENITLSIRPETIKMIDKMPVAPNVKNVFQGSVKNYIFEGSSARYWVETLGTELLIDVFDPGENAPYAGDVWFRIDPNRIHIIAGE